MLSFSVRRARSARPFCWELDGQVSRKMMPCVRRNECMAWLSNSFPLSVWTLRMGARNCV